MKKILLGLIIILASVLFTTSAPMQCKLINRTYSLCTWSTRNACCYLKDGCKMLDEVKPCKRKFHFLERELKSSINEQLKLEDEKYGSK